MLIKVVMRIVNIYIMIILCQELSIKLILNVIKINILNVNLYSFYNNFLRYLMLLYLLIRVREIEV